MLAPAAGSASGGGASFPFATVVAGTSYLNGSRPQGRRGAQKVVPNKASDLGYSRFSSIRTHTNDEFVVGHTNTLSPDVFIFWFLDRMDWRTED